MLPQLPNHLTEGSCFYLTWRTVPTDVVKWSLLQSVYRCQSKPHYCSCSCFHLLSVNTLGCICSIYSMWSTNTLTTYQREHLTIVCLHHFVFSWFVFMSIFSATARLNITPTYLCVPYQWNNTFCKLKKLDGRTCRVTTETVWTQYASDTLEK